MVDRILPPTAFALALALALPLSAQPLLTPREAVRIGLENNYDLSLSKDQTSQAVNNREAGIGPFLPGVSADASRRGTLGEPGGQTSLGVSASLQIFDGFQSYYSYERLKSQERAAVLKERLVVENTLEAILKGYFDIVQQKQRLAAIQELLAVSEERARLAQARMEVGAGSRLEQLQALADLNADSSSYLSQTLALRSAKLGLNQLLARNPLADFEVEDTIPLEASLPVDAWRSGLGERNAAIQIARSDRRSAGARLGESKAGYWPSLSAGLGYSTTPEAIGDGEPGTDVGYNVSLSVPLFDRLASRRDVRNSRLDVRQSETRLKQQEDDVRAQFEQALRQHASAATRVDLEERNLKVSEMQEEAARERYKVGATSPLEFRDAQTKLLDAKSRLLAARQDAKTSELALKRLAGELVREAPAGAAPGAEK